MAETRIDDLINQIENKINKKSSIKLTQLSDIQGNLQRSLNSNKNIIEDIFRGYNNLKEQSIETFYKLNLLVKSNLIVPLMSSTERVVDMVLSVFNKLNSFRLIKNQR